MTVSRALRGERAVDAGLVARVRSAALKLGYVPDPAARALASRHSTQVVVLIPMLSNALFVDLLEAVQRTLRPAGYQMLMGVTHYDPSEEEHLLREQLLHRPAGLLVTGLERNEATRALIAQSGVPCVHLMEASGAPGIYSVGFSQADAGAEMTRHLLQRGRRRIAFAAAQLDPRTLQRLEGWRRELRAAGLYEPTLEWLNPAPSSMALGARMFEQIMGQQPAVDAVFFCNDDLAQGALLAALRLGVAVPGRVAIAGFNDLTGSDQMLPPLTTVRTPRAEIGSAAARMLLSLMNGEAIASPCVDLGYDVLVRAST
jgi:LacI family gluconate utilization system Gnt-I transcriptional repressor